jgi:hypothetical protein
MGLNAPLEPIIADDEEQALLVAVVVVAVDVRPT